MNELLSVTGLTVEFGGVRALDSVDISVADGSIHGLVGPNGSGKTTLINAVSGFVRTSSGSIKFDGEEISRLAPHKRARRGISRSFQHPLMFGGLTIEETIGVGVHQSNPYSWIRSLVPVASDSSRTRRDASIGESARDFKLEVTSDKMSEISFGHQRLVDLSRSAAGNPRLLLLDEPASGLSEQEIESLVVVIAELRERGATILVTDHNMNFMARICDTLTVVNVGRNLAEGSPAAIRADSKVVDAYLGRTANTNARYDGNEGTSRARSDDGALSLRLRNITCAYDGAPVIVDASLCCPVGQITALVGPNGAGKTSLLRAISGTLRPSAGLIELGERDIGPLATQRRLSAGIAHVPQGRGMIDGLTVKENLEVGGYTIRDGVERKNTLESVMDIWPFLRDRSTQLAGSLSGGEQQMLSIARALMARPKIIMLDEPTLGLAPVMIDRLLEYVEELSLRGIGILLVEQNTSAAFSIADYGYVISGGRVVLDGFPSALAGSEELEHAFLGVAEKVRQPE